MGIVQVDSFRKDSPICREKSREAHLQRRNETLPETAELLALLPQAQSICNGLIHVAAVSGGKNNDYEDLHSGYALKQEV